jgi:hypothetical protein
LIGAIDDTDRSALLHALNDPNVSDGAVAPFRSDWSLLIFRLTPFENRRDILAVALAPSLECRCGLGFRGHLPGGSPAGARGKPLALKFCLYGRLNWLAHYRLFCCGAFAG